MKTSIKSIISSGLVLGALALGIATPSTANAQSQQLAKANIPFAFQIGKTVLPAGNYAVSSELPNVIKVSDNHGANTVMSIAMRADNNSPKTGPATISFTRYGDHYFLRQVNAPGSSAAYNCPKSKQEKTVAREMNIKNPQQVALNIEPQFPR